MSRVCGMIQYRDGAASASARTAAKNSRGMAGTNRGHRYLAPHARPTSVTQRAGITWSDPTGSITLRVAATGASSRNCSWAARSAPSRSVAVCSVHPAP
jgi:hypothetical protein